MVKLLSDESENGSPKKFENLSIIIHHLTENEFNEIIVDFLKELKNYYLQLIDDLSD